jgi:Tfp pilus assembly protein PilO
VAVLVVAGFGYVYWNYCLKPTNEKIRKTSAQLTEVLDKVETMKRTATRLPALERESQELQAEVGKTEKRLPRQKNVEEIIRILTEHSAKLNVAVISFSPSGETAQNYFIEVPFTLSVSGGLHSIAKFLTILGQQERILNARNLSLNYSPDPRRGRTVTGSFTLMAYVFRG